MNRHERRAHASRTKRFVAKCAMCESETCRIHVMQRLGKEDLGICKGCPCSKGACDSCGFTGEHWLGCRAVGLPPLPSKEAVQ